MEENQNNGQAAMLAGSQWSHASARKSICAEKEKSQENLKKIYQKEEEEKTAKRAADLGIAYADLNIIPIDPEALALVPEEKARKAEIAVVFKKGKAIKIAINQTNNQEAIAILNKLKNSGFNTAIFLASRGSLEKAWRGYADIINQNSAPAPISSGENFEAGKYIEQIHKLKEIAGKIPVTEVLNIIIAGALESGASDIHLEPFKNFARLRYRLDGVLHNAAELPLDFYPYAVSRIKMLAELKLNLSNIPQDGRFSVIIQGESVDLRVSSIPGSFGENFVIRILKKQTVSLKFEELGTKGRSLEILLRQIRKPNGMILTTGPTGSGKTTTLYSFLNKLNSPEIKIITLEDPVEYHIDGIEQTQIDSEAGYTFASGLRAILRQDPNIILVGEIRDSETADTAIQAALTGHLVFSTLHTNDASGAIPRLLNLDVDPALLGPAINAIIAQRLARKLCPFCKEQYRPAKETIKKIEMILSAISPEAKIEIPRKISNLYRPKGCARCNNTGYKGRIGIFEVLEINPEIEKIAASSHPSTSEIKKAAIKNGMATMLQDGILKALEGTTALEEVYRVAGEEESITNLY